MNHKNNISSILFLIVSLLTGCGGGGDTASSTQAVTYTIGGTVTGLANGASLVLQNNSSDNLTITANGNFTFPSTVVSGGSYNVTVLTHPTSPLQICTVNNGSGSNVSRNITSVTITCSNVYTVGGTITGLAGSGLVLQNNGGDDLIISADGSFTFAAPIITGSSYNVTVQTHPSSPTQLCDVINGNGNVTSSNITDVEINCADGHTIGGTVSGLDSRTSLILQNNGADDLTISADGLFTFKEPVLIGGTYAVTVHSQPTAPNQTCNILNGNGTNLTAPVTDIEVTCTTEQYTVGGTVYGLSGGESLVLQNNNTDQITINNNGDFIFNAMDDLEPYDVTILNQTVGTPKQCFVANETGFLAGTDVTDIAVICPSVEALYPVNGANWNDYVNNDGSNGFNANDTSCSGSGNSYGSCLHGGEMRVVILNDVTSCEGFTAKDSLNAFNWSCDDSTGTAQLISTSLRKGLALSDLIDFANPAWLENDVIISRSGNQVGRTPTTTWWSNPLFVDNDGGSLATPGTIYLVTTNPNTNYSFDENKIGLVVQPTIEMTGSGTGYVVAANGRNYLWVEGDINANGNIRGIAWDNVSYSVMRQIQVSNVAGGGSAAIYLQTSHNNILINTRVTNSFNSGLFLDNSSQNIIDGIVAINNGDAGIRVTNNSDKNLFTNIVTANNDNESNSTGGGFLIDQSSNDNKVINATVTNNRLSGLTINGSDGNLLMNFVGANNLASLLIITSDKTTIANLAGTDSRRYAVLVRNSNNNYFTGIFKTGNNIKNCQVDDLDTIPDIAPGLIDITCTDTGADGSSTYTGQISDATLETGVTTTTSFVGKVFIDDMTNTSDTQGAATLANISDWLRFENFYRGWGSDGNPYPDLSTSGKLPSCINYLTSAQQDEAACLDDGGTWLSNGRIWDWNLVKGDTGDSGGSALLDVLGLPIGDDTITHSWSDASTTTFLHHAIEIQGDAIGNDDGLCESNEACIYTPNIGGYQGHGNLLPAGPFTDSVSGGITGVELYQYESNGY
jgi:hypothetical protein